MSSPLPCLGGRDGHDHCRRKAECKPKKQLNFGARTLDWVAERCEELKAREEGWKEVGDAE